MNRLLALVAVASLGTGCVVEETCDVRVTWPDFQAASGAFVGCSGAGVDYVDVWVDGGTRPRVSVPCDQGFADLVISPGYHYWSVEGVDVLGDQQERIVNRHAFPLDDSCGFVELETTPAQGRVDLQYLFYSGGTAIEPQECREGGSFLWFSIFDWISNGPAILVDADSSPEAYTCGGPLVLPLPAGDFTLEWMEESGPHPDYALEAADCTDRDFLIAPAATTSVPVNLDLGATNECTRSALLTSGDSAGRASTPRKASVGAPPAVKLAP